MKCSKLGRNKKGSGKKQFAAQPLRTLSNKKKTLLKHIKLFPNNKEAVSLAKSRGYL